MAGNTIHFGTTGAPRVAGSSIVATADNTTFVTNSIISSGLGQTNISGTLRDGGHNICSDSSALFTAETSRNVLDPLLGPLSDNGGPTPTLGLLTGSPAIDAGDDSVCPATDQRGVPRPQGLACDIGAFELAPQLTLTRTAQGNVSLKDVFQAGYTNRLSASTDLIRWVELGTSVADTNGVSRFEDSDAAQLPARFYRVRIGTAP